MPQSRLKAAFIRGGTSKAIVFDRRELPADPAEWDAIFLAAMGSPDANGRQLDGMGGGLSSVSKVCIVGPPTRPDADIDYTFAQIQVKEASVDYSGNCGNMSSAMGPFAVEEGLAAAPADGEAVVRIHNTNTGKIIVARF
ncbi:MAG: PrpF domain-containing protein, partial [Alphaproteobacteria bacterium]